MAASSAAWAGKAPARATASIPISAFRISLSFVVVAATTHNKPARAAWTLLVAAVSGPEAKLRQKQ
jgi:hypothetical protein